MIESIQRSEILALCLRLGHDPSKVAAINITPASIDVIYTHPIVENREDRHDEPEGIADELEGVVDEPQAAQAGGQVVPPGGNTDQASD